MTEQLALLPEYLTGHLRLTLLALLFATVASVPLGILASRIAWLERPILGIAGVIQTVPGLALLAVTVPLLAAIGLPSIGFLPAIIGLTLYGILPILRNTVTGVAGIDPALVEAAKGVGMTDLQRLRYVDLPTAAPVIVAGIRTATVWIAGTATLSTPVGATSLGNYIFSGLQTRDFNAVIVGSAAAAALALLLDGLVHMLEAGIQARHHGRVGIALAVLVGLSGYTLATSVADAFTRAERPIVIGAKTFTEQYILGDVLAGQIERRTGRPTRLLSSLGSTVAFDALRSGDIDVYVDYSGTIWTTILQRTIVPDRASVLRGVAEALERDFHVTLVGALGFENAYALAVRGADADRLGLRRISDLVPLAPTLRMGSDYEFFARPEWASIGAAYGLSFASRISMDPSLMYQAISLGNVDVISAFSTDGRITAFDLRVLDDDRGAIPPYDAVILTNRRLVDEAPDVLDALGGLVNTIDAERMRAMNLAVDQGGRQPGAVAGELLDAIARDERAR